MMKKVEAQFDKLVKVSRRINSQGNFLLIFGAASMAISIMSQYMFRTGESLTSGIVGVIIAYAGICVAVLAVDGRSRVSKIVMIIALPLIAFFVAQLYR